MAEKGQWSGRKGAERGQKRGSRRKKRGLRQWRGLGNDGSIEKRSGDKAMLLGTEIAKWMKYKRE